MKIEFTASDVRPRAQKDLSADILFECGEDGNAAASELIKLRGQGYTFKVTVETYK